jgi:TRAP transporter TAXI family solute receptor
MTKLTISRRQALALTAGAAALPLIGAPAIAQSKTRITIVTGGTGGVFYPYGGGLAKILSEKGKDMAATAQVTGGSVDNVKLLHNGDAEVGFSTMDSAYDGMMGLGAYKDAGKHDVRLIAMLYDSFMHVIGSGDAKTVKDLKGKRVSVGSAGSSTESIADRVIAASGLDPMKDITRDNLGVAESAGALKDGKVAAFFWIGGIPTAAVRDLATSGQPPLNFIDTSAELAAMEKLYPGLYRPFNLNANAYAGQTAAVKGLGVANVLLVSAKAPNALVTGILSAMFDNLADVQAVHPAARTLTLQSAAAKGAVPQHPAAEAFYKSRGVA